MNGEREEASEADGDDGRLARLGRAARGAVRASVDEFSRRRGGERRGRRDVGPGLGAPDDRDGRRGQPPASDRSALAAGAELGSRIAAGVRGIAEAGLAAWRGSRVDDRESFAGTDETWGERNVGPGDIETHVGQTGMRPRTPHDLGPNAQRRQQLEDGTDREDETDLKDREPGRGGQ